MIKVEGLVKKFPGGHGLDGISLTVEKGERVSLFGPNGAGKTTFLHLLSGLLQATSGVVTVFGKDPSRQKAVLKKIGLAGQHSYLYEALTVSQNLTFYGKMFDMPSGTLMPRIELLLGKVGLSEKIDEPVSILSKGMKQRLVITRALLHDPDLLLLDEPFSGLDEGSAELVATLLKELEGKTVLQATHDFERGIFSGCRAVVFSTGKVLSDGAWQGDAAEFREFYRELTRPC